MAGGGLVRGSEDFKAVLAGFKSKKCLIHNYDTQTILSSNPEWSSKYDPVAFAQSIRNLLVATLSLRVPPVPPADQKPPPPGVAPPMMESIPSGFEMVSDDHLLALPKQIVGWVDTSLNKNNMLDPSILMKGYNFYHDGHNKIVAFKEHVKPLHGHKDSCTVQSVCRIQLPFQVEEQFCGEFVRRASYLTTTSQAHKILTMELMGVRSNYKTMKVEHEFGIDDSMEAESTARLQEQRRQEELLRIRRQEDMRRQEEIRQERLCQEQILYKEQEHKRQQQDEERQRQAEWQKQLELDKEDQKLKDAMNGRLAKQEEKERYGAAGTNSEKNGVAYTVPGGKEEEYTETAVQGAC
jgi:hypothetical protein